MYNEKNEMQKVNFGNIPVNWDEEEFAEEITVEDEDESHSLPSRKSRMSVIIKKNSKQT